MNSQSAQVIFLELNEINFDFVCDYVAKGQLKNFRRCLEHGSCSETTSETRYENIEPWIQWVTAHTGMPFSEHGIFRLGDIVDHDLPQIWESVEDRGVSVGAVSPMNAKNRTRSAAFFLPDPWTKTDTTGSFLAKRLIASISQAVNDNAKAKISAKSLFWLAAGALVYARAQNFGRYLSLALGSLRKPWRKAIFLDLLLADFFIKLTRAKKPGFATVFLNAGAHIQHHYLFSSRVYHGEKRNPPWYIDSQADPVFEIYEIYDCVLGAIQKAFPETRLMIATGLHQDPHEEVTFYWRLIDHAAFLSKHNIPFASAEARMSRDFVVICDSSIDAARAEEILTGMKDANDVALFEVDNRGASLFAMLTYPFDISERFEYSVAGKSWRGLRHEIAFVAIKNGQHNGTGYFVDMGAAEGQHEAVFSLAELPAKVTSALFAPSARVDS